MATLRKRTQMYLSDEQWALLEDAARRAGVSAAEIVRRAINAYCAPKEDFHTVLREVAGSWRHLDIDPERYVRDLRHEWESRSHA